MSVKRPGGATPLDRLTTHFDETATVCPACGYEDEFSRWEAHSDGSTVHYRHTCPSCGAVDRREVDVGR